MLRRFAWLSIVLALGGCAPGNPGLVLLNTIRPDDQCVFTLTGNSVTEGVLDIGQPNGGNGYTLYMRAANQLLNLGQSGASGVPMADPNLIQIRESEVEIRDASGAPIAVGGLPNPFRWPASGFVPSSDGSSPGEGLAVLQVVPPSYVAALAPYAGSRIVVAVRAIGVTAGAAEVESAEYLWPIDLCSGCLFACQRDESDVPLCIPTCNPGQDSITVTPAACGGAPVGVPCGP